MSPKSGDFKTNFDGAMFGKSDKAEIGVLIQNLVSQVMAALSEKILKPPLVEILEITTTKCIFSDEN